MAVLRMLNDSQFCDYKSGNRYLTFVLGSYYERSQLKENLVARTVLFSYFFCFFKYFLNWLCLFIILSSEKLRRTWRNIENILQEARGSGYF